MARRIVTAASSGGIAAACERSTAADTDHLVRARSHTDRLRYVPSLSRVAAGWLRREIASFSLAPFLSVKANRFLAMAQVLPRHQETGLTPVNEQMCSL